MQNLLCFQHVCHQLSKQHHLNFLSITSAAFYSLDRTANHILVLLLDILKDFDFNNPLEPENPVEKHLVDGDLFDHAEVEPITSVSIGDASDLLVAITTVILHANAVK